MGEVDEGWEKWRVKGYKGVAPPCSPCLYILCSVLIEPDIKLSSDSFDIQFSLYS